MPNSEVQFWRTYTKKTCKTHWMVSAFETSISGTLQRFDNYHWPREIKLTAILKTCLNYFMFLNQSEYSLELTSSWKQLNCELLGSKTDSGNMKRHFIGPAFLKNSTTCTRGFSSPVPSLWERKTSCSQGTLLTHPLQRPKQRDKFYKLTRRRNEESISDKHRFHCLFVKQCLSPRSVWNASCNITRNISKN